MTEEIGIRLFGRGWFNRLKGTILSPEFDALGKFLFTERQTHTVYPANEDVFKAFKLTPFDEVKVVLVGLDPYSNGSATGLCFAVPNHQLIPQPSLRVLLKDIEEDVYGGFSFDNIQSFDLEHWATNGVLMLNMALTVRKGEAESHLSRWRFFTDTVVKSLNEGYSGLVWVLLGKRAQEIESQINKASHHVITSGHPASAAYGTDRFSGNHVFSRVNDLLVSMNGIDAKIPW